MNQKVLPYIRFKKQETVKCPTDLEDGMGNPCAGQSNAKLWLDFASSPCILSTEGNFGTELPTGSMKLNWKLNLDTKLYHFCLVIIQ